LMIVTYPRQKLRLITKFGSNRRFPKRLARRERRRQSRTILSGRRAS